MAAHRSPADVPRLPDLQALALFVAVVDEGSLGAAARKLGLHQPNASRLIARLEAEAREPLLERHPRGSRPTSAGLLCAAHARELLESAREFDAWFRHGRDGDVVPLGVGASMTIAENLLPAWLAELRRRSPRVRVEPRVDNSSRVLEAVREGALRLGFVETPRVPPSFHARVVREDELAVVVAPGHPWAARRGPVSLAEVAATPLVVREGGSGTREAFEELVGGAELAPPAQVLHSNAAVRVALASGAGPAVLSALAVAAQVESGELTRVPLAGAPPRRPLTAVWRGPRRLSGAAAELVAVAAGARGAPGAVTAGAG
ncbi:transcriptional regulator [Streptomyces zhaozhouensis]|uniref:Transcriptional regulator n=1 Tax=Streptomyces zhaozhouensis TaxID=1300267 RepID=A0A286DWN1_9ACTN|nr:LysR family transcriptional regulator [Streptomyces zhaozhouensis]SOD63030.1 transcriptional regulator [Streptomyces zhaozhouensis]